MVLIEIFHMYYQGVYCYYSTTSIFYVFMVQSLSNLRFEFIAAFHRMDDATYYMHSTKQGHHVLREITVMLRTQPHVDPIRHCFDYFIN